VYFTNLGFSALRNLQIKNDEGMKHRKLRLKISILITNSACNPSWFRQVWCKQWQLC